MEVKSDNTMGVAWGHQKNPPNSQGERKLVDTTQRSARSQVVSLRPCEDSALPDWWVPEFKTQRLDFAESSSLFIALTI